MDYRSNNSVEEWRDVVGYEGYYQISNLGRVRNYKKHILSNHVATNGYLLITLCKNKIKKHCLIHRLVAQAFIPNYNDYPVINHKNEIKSDNRVENLEWCTRSYNSRYGNRAKKFVEHTDFSKSTKKGLACCHELAFKPILQFSTSGELLKKWKSATHYAKQFPNYPNMANSIQKCCRGINKTSYGYIWRYAGE